MRQNGLKILIADDHSVVRNGIIKSLSTKFSNVTFGEASNGTEALKAVYETNWDLVILDISMPGRSGLDVLKEIKQINRTFR